MNTCSNSSGFSIRGFNLVESVLRHSEDELRRFIRRMKTLSFNTLIAHYDYGWERFGDVILQEAAAADVDVCLMVFGPRTFLGYTDWKPNWLAKKSDGSLYTDRLECETKPCAAVPEAIEAYQLGAKKWLKNLPAQIRHVHVRCGDGTLFCECDHCRPMLEQDRWQPFVNAFTKAIANSRPDLAWETDLYVKRYLVPSDNRIYSTMDRAMYDTFFRHSYVPIGAESPNVNAMIGCTSETLPDATSPNVYHYNRMVDWTHLMPGKVYVHENMMGQGLLTIFQHNTSIHLKDLATYKHLGMQGVCYEAYEPGYEHFADQVKILSQAMLDPESAANYQPSALEQGLVDGRWPMDQFCTLMDCPLDEVIDDPVVREHVRNHRQFFHEPTAHHLRQLVEYVFEHADRFDPLFAGFFGCKHAEIVGDVQFHCKDEQTRDMLSYAKLWDFMETIPQDVDPRQICRSLIFDAIESAFDKA